MQNGVAELRRQVLTFESDGVARTLEQAPRKKRTGNCQVPEICIKVPLRLWPNTNLFMPGQDSMRYSRVEQLGSWE